MEQRNKSAGFTLVELLVAITVLAIVAVLGWRGLDSIVRARVGLTHEMEQTRGMQIAFAQMQADCDQITDPASIGGRRTLVVAPGRIAMIRTVFAENQPTRQEVVVYRLYNGQLVRYESAGTRDLHELDSMWQTAQGADAGQGIVLQSDVEALTIQTWYPDTPGWRSADAGSDSAPANAAIGTTTTQIAPTGLQVALQLRGHQTSMIKIFLLGAA